MPQYATFYNIGPVAWFWQKIYIISLSRSLEGYGCSINLDSDNLIGIIEPVSWVAMMMICMSSCLGIQILDAEHNIDNMINGHQNRDTEPHIASPW